MGTLWDLAQEYKSNQLPIERRLEDLRTELTQITSLEARRRLRHRINVLEEMLAESRRDVFDMEHYYDKGSRRDVFDVEHYYDRG